MKNRFTICVNDVNVCEGEGEALYDMLTAAIVGARMLNDGHVEANAKQMLKSVGKFL